MKCLPMVGGVRTTHVTALVDAMAALWYCYRMEERVGGGRVMKTGVTGGVCRGYAVVSERFLEVGTLQAVNPDLSI